MQRIMNLRNTDIPAFLRSSSVLWVYPVNMENVLNRLRGAHKQYAE